MRTTPWLPVLTIGLGLAVATGCASKKSDGAAPLPDCIGDNCAYVPPGGITPADAGTDSGTPDLDGSTTMDLTAALYKTTDEGFWNAAPWSTTNATITTSLPSDAGASVSVDTLGGAFTIPGMPLGASWISIVEKSPGGNLFPTITPVLVDPASPNVAVAAVDFAMFTTVATPLASPNALSATQAHAVIFFRKAKAALAGVSVVTGGFANAGAVAYDNSGGSFSVASPPPTGKTQAAGALMLINVPAVPPPGAAVTLQYTTPTGASSVSVQMAQGYVTWAAIEVQ